MEDLVKFFKLVYNEFGLEATITLAVIGLLCMITNKKIGDVLFNWFIKKFPDMSPKVSILRHPLFSKYMLLVNQRLKDIKCQCPLRKRIFSDLMITRINIYRKNLKEFAVREDLNKLRAAEFESAAEELVLKIFNEWKNQAKIEKIPDVVISRFEKVTDDCRTNLIYFIKAISVSDLGYHNNEERLCSVLDMLSSIEDNLMIKLETILISLNGEISEINYDGITCKHCKVCMHKKFSK